jgi:DNA modification methylase
MTILNDDNSVRLLVGDCREVLKDFPDASVDSVVTDPPYELGFMGKKWDASGVAYDVGLWGEVLRVLKPGGHLLAFGGTRTYHRMAVAIEDAGFEVRDSLHWLYGSGFPKSHNVSKAIDKAAGAEREVVGSVTKGSSPLPNNHDGHWNDGQVDGTFDITAPATDSAKQWDGWGTALKPAHEPIVVARKPLVGTVAGNVLEFGTGALNIDGCRVGHNEECKVLPAQKNGLHNEKLQQGGRHKDTLELKPEGRWPANIVFTHSVECVQVGTREDDITINGEGNDNLFHGNFKGGHDQSPRTAVSGIWNCVEGCPVGELDGQSGTTKGTARVGPPGGTTFDGSEMRAEVGTWFGDTGGASRFFTVTEWDPVSDIPFRYVAKPSKKERNAGLDGLEEKRESDRKKDDGVGGDNPRNRSNTAKVNHHPTVKPIALMRWLVKLVTPPGGKVLDPFAGSGTTLVAATLEGFDAVGVEFTEEYVPIIEGRVAWAQKKCEQLTLNVDDSAL